MPSKKQKHPQPANPSAGMTPAVRALIVKKQTDAAIVAALKPKFPPLTERIVKEVRARTTKKPAAAKKVHVVKKLPAPAAGKEAHRVAA